MKRLLTTASLCLSIALAGCSQYGNTEGQLPTVPSDIQQCFRAGAVTIPDRALSVYDVESLWKKDRVKIAVLQKCGQRFLAWYQSLKESWK